MYVVVVRVEVVPERVDEFVEATLDNARNSRLEEGNQRFDVNRANDEPHRFCLYEVYTDEAAFQAHQKTEHYLRWRDRVAPMMAAPRKGERFTSVFPETAE